MTARPIMFGIYREPRPNTREFYRRTYGRWVSPRPRRMAVIEAATARDALEAFAKAEQVRSSQVDGWHVAAKGPRLVITFTNGRSSHEASYVAWRQDL